MLRGGLWALPSTYSRRGWIHLPGLGDLDRTGFIAAVDSLHLKQTQTNKQTKRAFLRLLSDFVRDNSVLICTTKVDCLCSM